MCSDNCGSDLPEAGECPECGEPVDKEGYTLQRCAYSTVACQTCENAPCDGAC